ncbi:hypothetical protein Pcinc_023433 [Petrolisthes cinctipes]|uniref:Uncharacterized protein n=1 Tax=Petrolisthes cinctipes TaxID=88211 RepID=A0AAE1KFT0_PETCI|nr:hypothetical protein Pcinc_023433 [Petrolisthes cinctipes]
MGEAREDREKQKVGELVPERDGPEGGDEKERERKKQQQEFQDVTGPKQNIRRTREDRWEKWAGEGGRGRQMRWKEKDSMRKSTGEEEREHHEEDRIEMED